MTGLLMGVVNHMLVVKPMLEQFANKPEYTFVWFFTLVGYGIALLFMGYYVLMMYMLTRPAVLEAFTPGDADDDRGGWDRHPGPGAGSQAGGVGL